MFIGVPAIINRKGIKEMVKLNLDAEDQEKFDHSCELLSQIIKDQIDEIIEND